jgi:hypothetical protein
LRNSGCRTGLFGVKKLFLKVTRKNVDVTVMKPRPDMMMPLEEPREGKLMAITAPQFVPFEMKTSIVKICSYEDKNPRGVLTNPYHGEDKVFSSLSHLIFLMEELQDSLNYPQKSTAARCFGASESVAAGPGGDMENAKALATFKIRILFRQNSSWQGNVIWMEKDEEAQFRSVLELIYLLDSAMNPQTA